MYRCISRPSSTKCSKCFSFRFIYLFFHLMRPFGRFCALLVASVCFSRYHFLFFIPYVSLILTRIQSAILTHFRWEKRVGKKACRCIYHHRILWAKWRCAYDERTWYTHTLIIQCVWYTLTGFFSRLFVLDVNLMWYVVEMRRGVREKENDLCNTVWIECVYCVRETSRGETDETMYRISISGV